MRLFLVTIGSLIFASACSSTTPVAGPVDAQQVNPDIEERIQQRVAAQQAQGYPDLAEIRTEGPTKPSQRYLQRERVKLRETGDNLITEVARDRSETDGTDLAAKAQQVRRAVARDRALAAADSELVPLPERSSKPE